MHHVQLYWLLTETWCFVPMVFIGVIVWIFRWTLPLKLLILLINFMKLYIIIL